MDFGIFSMQKSEDGAVANRSLSIPEWHEMALQGVMVPTRIQLGGNSMAPLIRRRKDYVNIIPVSDGLETGDIVLIADFSKDRYVLHRVWELEDTRVLTWGDNSTKPDGWFPMEQIWGKVILIERGSRKIKPDPKKGKRWAAFWHQAGKVYRLLQRIKADIVQRIK